MDILIRLEYGEYCTILELDFNNMEIERKVDFFTLFFEWRREINTFGISINTFRNIHNDWKNLCENRKTQYIKYSRYGKDIVKKGKPIQIIFE
jgi:hypothetical protein